MDKIVLILSREYLVRVRKKSFVIMTILGPLLFGALMILPAWFAIKYSDARTVGVLDESGLFANLKGDKKLNFVPVTGSLAEASKQIKARKHDGLLYIPKTTLDKPAGMQLLSPKSIPIDLEIKLEKTLNKEIENQRLVNAGINRQVLEGTRADVDIATVDTSKGEGQRSNSGVATAIGYLAAGIIYFAIFVYGVQIMRGVLEEKTSRIVEVIISSVKPFQLMMGKIVGIGLVGLTQFLLWIVLGTAISTAVGAFLPQEKLQAAQQEQVVNAGGDPGSAPSVQRSPLPSTDAISRLVGNLNIPLLLGTFLFYFLGGYLLYSSLFAAVGAAVDNETDTQQFMLPITIPLILSFILAQFVVRDPDGPLAFWLSIIPLTSPIVMMVRIPFVVPGWQIALSMALLVAGFIFTTWLAGRIYRVGVLMYGKKPTVRELSRWLFYKA